MYEYLELCLPWYWYAKDEVPFKFQMAVAMQGTFFQDKHKHKAACKMQLSAFSFHFAFHPPPISRKIKIILAGKRAFW